MLSLRRFVRLWSLMLMFSAGTLLFAGEGPTPFPDAANDKAWPGTGPIRVHPWMKDNRAWFWSQRDKAQGAVVFAGDSLTGNWKSDQMQAAFPGLKIANRGIGGDVSRGLLFRLQEDVLALKPKALVLLIGTNDLSAHATPAGVMENPSIRYHAKITTRESFSVLTTKRMSHACQTRVADR